MKFLKLNHKQNINNKILYKFKMFKNKINKKLNKI